jgi:N-acetylmuramoyl-L-alanine amidase CwlA
MARDIAIGKLDAKANGIQIDHSIKCNAGNYQNKTSRKVKYPVFHYTGNKKDTAKNNALYFKNNDVDVSAHFFVDDTSIYQSVDLNDIAYHCGTTGKYYHKDCRNANSIGIEMCCTAGNYKISAKTLENSAYLGAMICELLNITSDEVDTYCLRHYDITHKKCPAQMVDDVAEWNEFKAKIKSILKAKEQPKPDDFLPARGYFKKGDTSTKISKIATFMRKMFPTYTPALALGPYFGKNLEKAVKEFQKRTGLKADGNIGPLTLAKLKEFGFKY